MEEYAYILDYLAQGYPDNKHHTREPIAYGLGESEFKLLELVPLPNAIIQIGDKVFIGKDKERRDKIQGVRRRINYSDLTAAAQNEMPYILLEIVRSQEERFVRFYNEAHAISTRFHMLELLPGLGKKIMWSIIEEQKKGPFKSFEDLADRVPKLHTPERPIIKRIELELSDPTLKYRLFVAR